MCQTGAKMATYRQAVQYISEIPKFTKKNCPEHTKAFLHALGDPQDSLKVIHVAGTNGKGSVCSCIDVMLRAEGKRTGLFLSPHLVRMNERIVIDGQEISDDDFAAVYETVLEQVHELEKQGIPHPTFFEFLFGMAVYAFAEAGVEYAVLETGLGGRLDATNCVEHPVCSVITSIGMDHTRYLGDTLEKIAGEKAGIFKRGVPAYYIEGKEESNRTIERKAAELGISCKKVRKNAFKILEITEKSIAFSCADAYYGDVTWILHNTGLYQVENTMLALEVMRGILGEYGHPKLWRDALAESVWTGRMEEVAPGVYADGAHNPDAVERFAQSVAGRRGIGILFSAVEDKDYSEMIRCLCEEVDADFYVVTHITDRRAADAATLAGLFGKYTDRPVIVKESLRDAWDYCMEHQEGRNIYCIGSLYLVGMIREFLDHIEEELSC